MKLLLTSALLFMGSFLFQKESDYTPFINYITKNYDFPETVKKNCSWNYMVVKIYTNANNKIIKYIVLNETPEEEKKGLSVLLRYTFPKSVQLNNHPLIFFLSIDNSRICDPDLPQRFYPPNEAIGIYTNFIKEELKIDPSINIIWGAVVKGYFPTER